MAAVAVGTSIWLPAILFGHVLLLALTPTVAQLNGTGRRERIPEQIRQAYWLAFFVAVLIMVVLWNARYVIRAMHNIDEQLALKAEGYLHALLWGAPGYPFFRMIRNQCEGRDGIHRSAGEYPAELDLYLRLFQQAGAGRRGDRLGLLCDVSGDTLLGVLHEQHA